MEPPKRTLWSAKGAALRAKRSQDETQDGAKAVQVRKGKLLKFIWFYSKTEDMDLQFGALR